MTNAELPDWFERPLARASQAVGKFGDGHLGRSDAFLRQTFPTYDERRARVGWEGSAEMTSMTP